MGKLYKQTNEWINMNKMNKKAEVEWWVMKSVYVLAALVAILLIIWLIRGAMGDIISNLIGRT